MITQRYPQAILISCESPWDEHERLMEDMFRREVRMVLSQGFRHVYVFGTAGEGYAVDTPRFKQIVNIFREETNQPDVHAMVGVIGLSSANIIERIQIAYDIGFRTFQISLPSWAPLRDEEVLRFFNDVCGAFPDSGFLHYNLPRAKRLLTGIEYRRIADAVPNLVATKNTGGGLERARDLMIHAPEIQHFFSEANFIHGCHYGPCSLLSSFGPLSPQKAHALFKAGLAGRTNEMHALQHAYHDLLRIVFGPLLDEARIDGAYDKMIVRLGGLTDFPLRLLSPYSGFSEIQYAQLAERMHAHFGDWLT
jgi:dihydrodipicolinate synthase/N-acetylneuraminate lyase